MKCREEWHLDTRRLGRRVLVFDRLDSTNTYAAGLAHDPANDGVVVLADAQTAGRGQHGRTWLCPPGSGVLLSVLLFPPPALRRPVLLAAWAAVAVCRTIEQTTRLVTVQIKWPNDVLLGGRKVCGILIEQGKGTVAGIGLNVNQSPAELAAAGLPLAGSLAQAAGRPLDRRHVCRTLIAALDDEYDRLCRGDIATLEAGWKERLGLLGQEVAVECREATYFGRLLGLSWSGLALEQEHGGTRQISPEVVQHVQRVE